MEHRKNEQRQTWFRSGRFFSSNAQWYFHTREGIDVGPFNSEFEAQVEASILKSVLKGGSVPALQVIREFLLDVRTQSSNLSGLTDYVTKEGHF
jgi:hypothetical protein